MCDLSVGYRWYVYNSALLATFKHQSHVSLLFTSYWINNRLVKIIGIFTQTHFFPSVLVLDRLPKNQSSLLNTRGQKKWVKKSEQRSLLCTNQFQNRPSPGAFNLRFVPYSGEFDPK